MVGVRLFLVPSPSSSHLNGRASELTAAAYPPLFGSTVAHHHPQHQDGAQLNTTGGRGSQDCVVPRYGRCSSTTRCFLIFGATIQQQGALCASRDISTPFFFFVHMPNCLLCKCTTWAYMKDVRSCSGQYMQCS